MKPKISYHPPGYDPTQDRLPPRQATAGPLITCGMLLLFACGVIGFLAGNFSKGQAGDVVTPESTPEVTMDDWSLTGTALYFVTLTPQTATPTHTATATETPTVEMTYTPVVTNTPDNWQSTGTAIFIQTASIT
ncbi:MAG: hypothetical protein K8L97_15230, partial [Anaerolineae bacterium]|nr:hypothetical protein [Anaerolineae bacterium]